MKILFTELWKGLEKLKLLSKLRISLWSEVIFP